MGYAHAGCKSASSLLASSSSEVSGASLNQAEYYYPNNQSARMIWYHDHAHGITRINAYAGIASGYVIFDDYELSLVANNNLPGPLDPRTHYLVFQDKIFKAVTDQWGGPGDLWYPSVYPANIKGVPFPMIFFLAGQRGAHTALRRAGVRAGGIQLADHGCVGRL